MENGETAKSMALVNIALPTKITTKANFQMATVAEKGNMLGLMAVFMMESGRRIR